MFVLTAYEIINNEHFFTNYSNNVSKINYLCLIKFLKCLRLLYA